jgi:hypothetical protein
MKLTRLLVAPLVLGALLQSGAAFGQDFPLICRGGASMRFKAAKGNVDHTFNILGLFFDKGTRPARLGLAPGHCSWIDRGMSAAEPDILQQEVGPNVTSALWFRELKDPARYWTFRVHTTPAGVLLVSFAEPRSNL